jgi:hypothetical protein
MIVSLILVNIRVNVWISSTTLNVNVTSGGQAKSVIRMFTSAHRSHASTTEIVWIDRLATSACAKQALMVYIAVMMLMNVNLSPARMVRSASIQ